ncbi:MAG: hypothetical protein ABW278_02955 [Steroidobacteraceae bacterium]
MTDAMPMDDKTRSLKTLTLVVYILYAATWITGISGIVAIIINYVKRDEVRGTWLDSHFSWQIRTFWWSLLWAIIGWALVFVLIGIPILIADGIWVIYRLVKGFLQLNENKPITA